MNRKATRVTAESAAMTRAQAAPIAIIGMSGRFPGANDLDEYWANLANGVESIAILSQEDMRAAGIPEHISKLPGYVNASPVLDKVDEFDAQFFGFSARDAALTDPQHRLFLETAWQALEDAGHDPARFPGAIGVFGGCELSTYLYHLHQNLESLKYVDGMQLMVTNDKDHLCTQVSYRLNLRGPSVSVQTTCSTSLVAVSLACESLQQGGCDMALAGGVTVRVPQRGGYFYTPGSILSPDGHCRPFDAKAQGTIVGSGVGVVVLKRLSDALEQGDNVRAVIRAVAVNNDGNQKVGYTAPSARGQAAAIRAAHRISGVSADSIGYVEAHGTGTILGDPIEFSALTEVFRETTSRRGFCGIGSAKSNFGHLSCAAGVAGLIKTVLALENGAIPPTVHYTTPNPAIDLVASPFFLTTRLQPWERNGIPRRAGVSSFGVGGTNAHAVIEEAPPRPTRTGKRSEKRSHQLLLLSARTESALKEASARLGAHLRRHPELDLADVAYTLHLGRRFLRDRRAVVVPGDDVAGAAGALDPQQGLPTVSARDSRPTVFMFPGQGSQYLGMASGLYRSELVVRRAIDRCARNFKVALGADLRRVLFPSRRNRKHAEEALKDTKWAQPALFTVGYALAELWNSWGIRPAAMIGHSVGEYVAATLAGVMRLEDALAVIARRGQLISALPCGLMLAVMGPASSFERFLGGDVCVAAINGPSFVVLSGPGSSIERVERELADERVPTRRLHTSHAFHSGMMDPILAEFEDVVAGISLSPPATPFVATLTGRWADEAVAKPKYWSQQLRRTVRFSEGVRSLMEPHSRAGKDPVYLETGPGTTLATFTLETAKEQQKTCACLPSLPGPDGRRSDTEEILMTLGQLWAHGVDVDWDAFHRTEQRSRVSLPTYPFERQSYWVGTNSAAHTKGAEVRDPFNWFYRPVWREEALSSSRPPRSNDRRILLFDRETSPAAAICARLRERSWQVVRVRPGESFACISDSEYTLDPKREEGFRRLATAVCAGEARLAGVIDCWTATAPGTTDLNSAAVISLLGPMRLAHALSSQPTMRPLPVLLVARGTTRVYEEDALDPARALGAGVARVLPQEHAGLRVAHVDVDDSESAADMVLAELEAGIPEPAVAIRHGRRFVEAFEPAAIRSMRPALNLPPNPVVMITGGLGHMGLNMAEALFTKRARLVLIGRSTLPPPDEWAAKSEDPATSPQQKVLLGRLARMRAERDEVLVLNADLNDAELVKTAVDDAVARFGQVDMVIHGAARIDAGAFASAAETGWDVVEAQFSPKLRGLLHLMDAMRRREPRRWILHSSVSTVLGGLGLAAYSAANAVLDAIACGRGANWLSIDWDAWDNAAEAQSASMPLAIRPAEGNEVLLRILGAWEGSRVVVAVNLADRLKAWVRRAEQAPAEKAGVDRHPRPTLVTAYVEPRTDTERRLADIWGSQLGVDAVGIHDRFFDLGGHSLLAAQIASEICDRFQIELPVLKLFEAPTVGELAVLVDRALAGKADLRPAGLPHTAEAGPELELQGNAPEIAAKAGYRDFYNDVTRKLDQSGVGAASFFLNYGYVSLGDGDEARFEVSDRVFNRNSVRLALELIGDMQLKGRRVLDVGCGRGGTVELLGETFEAEACGVDLSPEAVAFCRKTHQHAARFEVGDAEHLPFEDSCFDVVTNVESSHTYPNLRAFFGEVQRVLIPGGHFLYADLLPVTRWAEVRALLSPLGFRIQSDRDITTNVLASCDEVAANRAKAFGGSTEAIDNFLAVPGSAVYEQMHSGAWEYRILRAKSS